MAEFVQFRIEEMMTEVEELHRLQLFSRDEIKKLIRRRKDFEYRLQRQTKRKKDYLSYIQYELGVRALIKVRRRRLGVFGKRRSVEFALQDRVIKLFRMLTVRWPEDQEVWKSYIHTCQQMRMFSQVSPGYASWLRFHAKEPGVWRQAILWECRDAAGVAVDSGRRLALRALRHHPKHPLLFAAMFHLESALIHRIVARLEVLSNEKPGTDGQDAMEHGEDVVSGALLAAVFEESLEQLGIAEKEAFIGECLKTIKEFNKIPQELREKVWEQARDLGLEEGHAKITKGEDSNSDDDEDMEDSD